MATLQTRESSEPHGALGEALALVAGRERGQRRARGGVRGLIVALTADLALAALWRADLLPDGPFLLPTLAALAILGTAIGAYVSSRTELSPMQAARLAEGRLPLKERLSSALEFGPLPGSSALLALQHADAEAHARTLDTRGAVPRRIPREVWLVPLLLIALALLLLLPALPFGPSRSQRAEREAVRGAGRLLAQAAHQAAAEAEARHDPAAKREALKTEALGKRMAQGHMDRAQALAAVARREQQIAEARRPDTSVPASPGQSAQDLAGASHAPAASGPQSSAPSESKPPVSSGAQSSAPSQGKPAPASPSSASPGTSAPLGPQSAKQGGQTSLPSSASPKTPGPASPPAGTGTRQGGPSPGMHGKPGGPAPSPSSAAPHAARPPQAGAAARPPHASASPPAGASQAQQALENARRSLAGSPETGNPPTGNPPTGNPQTASPGTAKPQLPSSPGATKSGSNGHPGASGQPGKSPPDGAGKPNSAGQGSASKHGSVSSKGAGKPQGLSSSSAGKPGSGSQNSAGKPGGASSSGAGKPGGAGQSGAGKSGNASPSGTGQNGQQGRGSGQHSPGSQGGPGSSAPGGGAGPAAKAPFHAALPPTIVSKSPAIALGTQHGGGQATTTTRKPGSVPTAPLGPSRVPYGQALPRARESAEAALDQDHVPPSQRALVRDYFNSLPPAK